MKPHPLNRAALVACRRSTQHLRGVQALPASQSQAAGQSKVQRCSKMPAADCRTSSRVSRWEASICMFLQPQPQPESAPSLCRWWTLPAGTCKPCQAGACMQGSRLLRAPEPSRPRQRAGWRRSCMPAMC